MAKTEIFLTFKGKKSVLLAKNGKWRIAMKPTCEALGVDFEALKAKHRKPTRRTSRVRVVQQLNIRQNENNNFTNFRKDD